MSDKSSLKARVSQAFRGKGVGLFAPDRSREAIVLYDEIRRVEPVFRLDERTWLVTRYDDAKAVLRDTRFSSLEGFNQSTADTETRSFDVNRSILRLNPPEHTRLRALVQQPFLPGRINRLEGAIKRTVNDLLDAVADKGRMDVIADLARPLPMWVVSTLLGIPMADRDLIQQLAEQVALLPDQNFVSEQERNSMLAAMRTVHAYFNDLVDKRRSNPGDDVLSALIEAESDGTKLTQSEIVNMADLLIVAGYETTVNLIGNGTRIMLDHPGTLERLAAEPELIPSAVEECLRFSSSVAINGRTATGRLTIGEQVVVRGENVMIPLDAVNRDPERFPDPHRFDVARIDNQHLSFSIGPHVCLGATLARLEARVAWRALLARFRDLRAAGPSPWRKHISLRGLEALPVSFALI